MSNRKKDYIGAVTGEFAPCSGNFGTGVESVFGVSLIRAGYHHPRGEKPMLLDSPADRRQRNKKLHRDEV